MVPGTLRTGASPLLRRILLVLIAALSLVGHVVAGERVYFDAPTTVAVRDVTTDEFRAGHPHERLIELKLFISAMIEGEPKNLELNYAIDFPGRGLEIVDYLPKTTLSSEIAGNIGIETHDEDCSTLGLVVTGAQPPFTGTLNGNITGKDSLSVRYELLPPLETVAASGTLNRRTSAYFRMRTAPRISLEGDKEFVLMLRVPETWRGTYLALRCEGYGEQRVATPPFKDRVLLGRSQFVVGLYRAGDEPARLTAHQFAQAELRLRQVAVGHHRQTERHAYPTVVHKVGVLLSLTDARLPSNWVDAVIYSPPARADARLKREAPPAVQQAVQAYLAARSELIAMSK